MIRAVVIAAIALGLFAAGWWQGRASERAAWQARVAAAEARYGRAQARAQGLSDALDRERAARAELARRLEEAADADEDAGRVALPERAVQRLQQRGAR